MTAAVAALSFGAYADVTYQLVYRGKNDANADPAFNVNKGVNFTADGKGGYYVTVPEINTTTGGFKIIHNDQTVLDQMTEEIKLAKQTIVDGTGNWYTQWGALPDADGAVVVNDEEGSPLKIVDFFTQVKETGHTPGEIQFAGGVRKVTNATVYFWPADKAIKVTGTIDETTRAQFGICNAANEWKAPTGEYLFKHEGKGIYTGSYDFGTGSGVKTFKIRPVNNVKPIYGFAKDNSNQAFGPAAVEPAMTRSGDVLTQKLTAYHIDSEKRRDAGDASKSASTSVTLPTTIKANVTGKYDLRFDANTGELTMTPTADNPTAVAEIAADENAPVEYFNMQGVKVENPENGIYVRKQGSKVSKVVVK